MKDNTLLADVQREKRRRMAARKTRRIVLASVASGVVLAAGVGWVWSSLARPAAKSSSPKIGVVHDVKDAPFNFLVPGANAAWTYDTSSQRFDPDKGVMQYGVKLTYSNDVVTISQQLMPDELKPVKSDKFMAFINSSNVVRSQQAGPGTLYFIGMNQVGGSAPGTDAVIYATDDILLFGRTGSVVGYDAWAGLMASMKKEASK